MGVFLGKCLLSGSSKLLLDGGVDRSVSKSMNKRTTGGKTALRVLSCLRETLFALRP